MAEGCLYGEESDQDSLEKMVPTMITNRALTIMVVLGSLALAGCGARQPQATPKPSSQVARLRRLVSRRDPSVRFISARPQPRAWDYEPRRPMLFISTPETPAKSVVVFYTAIVPRSSSHWTVDMYEAAKSRPNQLVLMSHSTAYMTPTGLMASTHGEAPRHRLLKVQLLPRDIRIGTSWESPMPGQTSRSIILGTADITTAAGHFQNCLVVFQRSHFTGSSPQQIVYVTFLAPHLGEVKQISWWYAGPIPEAFQLLRVVQLHNPHILGQYLVPVSKAGWPLIAPWQS